MDRSITSWPLPSLLPSLAQWVPMEMPPPGYRKVVGPVEAPRLMARQPDNTVSSLVSCPLPAVKATGAMSSVGM